MSGHRPFSELTKNFTPEQRRRIEEETQRLLAEIRKAEQLAEPDAVEDEPRAQRSD